MTTPLYPTFAKHIDDAIEQLLHKQVNPWALLNTGLPMRVTTYDGRNISYQGGGFEGSSRLVFWSRYIEPFLEALTIKEITAAVAAARERGVDAKLLLPEVQGLLLSSSRKVFARMAHLDQRLLGKGHPQSVGLRSIENEVAGMKEFIDKHVRAELEMWRPEPGGKPSEKEREQKFGLLCSLRQASVDFASYCSGLTPDAAIGVLFLDIDNFKSHNTRFTEVVVDREILTPFQKLLGAYCAHRGEAYRHGGEEFLVLLPNQTPTEVTNFANRLCEQIAAAVFPVGNSHLHITVSIGIALWPKDGETLEVLIDKANSAEHEAKARGKNRIVIHGEAADI